MKMIFVGSAGIAVILPPENKEIGNISGWFRSSTNKGI